MKVFDSELKIMELIWQHEPVSAKELSLPHSFRIRIFIMMRT
jgi:hypothetical protein